MDDFATDSIIPAQPVVVRKRCTKCGEEKDETDFYVVKKATGRRNCQCKRCVINAVLKFGKDNPDRVWGNKPENQEKKKALWRDKYNANPEKFRAIALAAFNKRKDAAHAKQRERYHQNPKAAIAKTVKWRNNNPDKCRAWVIANRDKTRAIVKRHRLKFPEAHFVARANRRARKEDGATRLSMGIRATLMQWQNGLCPYCRADLNVVSRHLDHVIPLARGGKHCDANMQLTCKPCNLRKHAKDPILFGREMGIFTPSTELAI